MTAAFRKSRLSTEYVLVPFGARASGAAVDPSTLPVAVAFTSPGAEPAEGDWASASWQPDGAGGWDACILAGPDGDADPVVGAHDVWLRVTSDPEIPVLLALGRLVVF